MKKATYFLMLLLLLVSLVACKGESNVDIVTTTEAKSTAENSIEEIETTTIEEALLKMTKSKKLMNFQRLPSWVKLKLIKDCLM